jgi:hypothetical protein
MSMVALGQDRAAAVGEDNRNAEPRFSLWQKSLFFQQRRGYIVGL